MQRPSVGPATSKSDINASPMNAMAIAAFVGSLFLSVLGPIFGFIALRQIRRNASRGRGFAIAGIAIGSIGVLVTVVIPLLLYFADPIASGRDSKPRAYYVNPTTAPTPPRTTSSPSATVGGSYSPALCLALTLAKSADKSFSEEQTAENQKRLKDAFEKLKRTTRSQAHRDVYAGAVDLLAAPSVDKSEFQEMKGKALEALEADRSSCG